MGQKFFISFNAVLRLVAIILMRVKERALRVLRQYPPLYAHVYWTPVGHENWRAN